VEPKTVATTPETLERPPVPACEMAPPLHCATAHETATERRKHVRTHFGESVGDDWSLRQLAGPLSGLRAAARDVHESGLTHGRSSTRRTKHCIAQRRA
jgi:hypothetical protein